MTLRTLATLASGLEVTVENLIGHTTNPLGAPTKLDSAKIVVTDGDVLLVEKSATDAALVVKAFKQAKLTNCINAVRDAETALDYLLGTGRYAKRHPPRPALILLDVNLPRMSGLEFLRRVKTDENLRSTPVVVLTVSRTHHIIFECAKLSVADYLLKPLAVESLVRLMPRLNLQLTIGAGAEAGRPVP